MYEMLDKLKIEIHIEMTLTISKLDCLNTKIFQNYAHIQILLVKQWGSIPATQTLSEFVVKRVILIISPMAVQTT